MFYWINKYIWEKQRSFTAIKYFSNKIRTFQL